jgi:hypothetical protein
MVAAFLEVPQQLKKKQQEVRRRSGGLVHRRAGRLLGRYFGSRVSSSFAAYLPGRLCTVVGYRGVEWSSPAHPQQQEQGFEQ